jgi:hypothetical protein
MGRFVFRTKIKTEKTKITKMIHPEDDAGCTLNLAIW